MQYMLLIYEQPSSYEGFSDAERAGVSAEYAAIREDARVVGGGRLQSADTATTVRLERGATLITDGPFADTKEVFGGYYLVEAEHLDAALDIATRIPAARLGGSVEIRPLVEPER